MRVILALSSSLVLTSCAMDNKPMGTLPRGDSVKRIQLKFSAEELGPAAGNAARNGELSAAISHNLRSHGYQVYTTGDREPATHLMGARVTTPQRKSTPPGLSFSFGNSDPRALDFQKTDVVTVTCWLSAAAEPDEAVTLSGNFAVDVGLTNWLRGRREQALTAYYVDRIGTVCLNLLTNLSVPKAHTPETIAAEAPWTPEVRVEVRDKPATGGPTAGVPVAVSGRAADTEPVAPTVAMDAAKAPVPEPVTTETQNRLDDGHKQVIIHNRGNPVILEFGYERR